MNFSPSWAGMSSFFGENFEGEDRSVVWSIRKRQLIFEKLKEAGAFCEMNFRHREEEGPGTKKGKEMTNRSIRFLLLGLLASFAVAAKPTQSGEVGCYHGHGGGWMAEKSLPADIVKELKLSAAQVQKAEQLLQKTREASRPLMAALEEAREALKQALSQPSLDEETLMAKLSAVSAAKLELQKSHMKGMLALRQELGPEQWEKLRAKKLMYKGKKGKRGKGGLSCACMEGGCTAKAD
jgi:Spy/CpxP family protein refolding chaperone